MYTTQCPGCGTTLIANQVGLVWMGCQTCHYYGQMLVTPATPSVQSPPPAPASPAPASPAPASAPVTPRIGSRTGSTTSADMRDEIRETVFALAGDICEALRDLPESEWNLSLPAAYERLQEAHTPLFEALGGRHMGDYAPDTHKVASAVVTTAMRLLLALHAAERIGW